MINLKNSFDMNNVGACMGINRIPETLRNKFYFEERGHAQAILENDFPEEYSDLCDCLNNFVLKKSQIVIKGGARSTISTTFDNFFLNRRWKPKAFKVKTFVDDKEIPIPTHEIDNFKNKIGIEIEWNNKTEFYDRDLNNFRLLSELQVIAVGVIITRMSELQKIFNNLGIGKKYGNSTTHWNKLIPKVDSGGAGGCPLLLVGIKKECYDSTS